MKRRVLSAIVIAVLTVALMSGFAVAKDLEFQYSGLQHVTSLLRGLD